MNEQVYRSVFFISDGTGITAETLAHSLLHHFPSITFRQIRLPFINSIDRTIECCYQIEEAHLKDGIRPIVFSTIVSKQSLDLLHQSDALFIDLFEQFIDPLEHELGVKATQKVGRFHDVTESGDYKNRIDAINFAMSHDDGVSSASELIEADVILIGVSRSGKTPTSLYLAMQYGIKAANYPLIPEDFERKQFPSEIISYRDKLFGLTIEANRLMKIRQERRANSHYASLENCKYEIAAAQKLMNQENIPWLDSTSKSIEEIAAVIMHYIRPVTVS